MIRDTGPRERADLVVVGGGLAGLMAAALVAREGRTVVVLERAARLGGRAATHVTDGIHFNLGPHALCRSGCASRVLRELDVAVSGRIPNPGRGLLLAGDRAYRLPRGPGSLLLSRLLTVREKVGLVRFLASLPGRDARALDRTPLSAWIESVARFFLGVVRKATPDLELRRVRVNGRPGVLIVLDGQIFNVLTLDVVGGRIAACYAIRNPDKLARVPLG